MNASIPAIKFAGRGSQIELNLARVVNFLKGISNE